VVITGDYQPAEKKFEVSRRMLEVCLELGFPVSVLERSPLVLRDLDLINDINARAPPASSRCAPFPLRHGTAQDGDLARSGLDDVEQHAHGKSLAPLGPRRPTTSPSRTVNDSLSTALTSP